MVIKAQTLMISEFFNVFSMMDLNTLGAKIIGNPNATIKNDVQSNNNCGKLNIRK